MAKSTEQPKQPLTTVKPRPKEPRKYVFRLLRKVNPALTKERDIVTFGEFHLVQSDEILWAYHEDGTPFKADEIAPAQHDNFLPRTIRYISGIKTIFVDEQEINGKEIDPKVVEANKNKDDLKFVRNQLEVPKENKTLKLYLHCCNQIKNQHPNARKFKQLQPVYEMLDFAYAEQQKVKLGQLKEEAFQKAKSARWEELKPHALYLGVLFTNEIGEERDMDSIRMDYIDAALSKPEEFLKTFASPKIKLLDKIKQLTSNGDIFYQEGAAYWKNGGAMITLIPSDVSFAEALCDFAMKEDGADFVDMLNSLV